MEADCKEIISIVQNKWQQNKSFKFEDKRRLLKANHQKEGDENLLILAILYLNKKNKHLFIFLKFFKSNSIWYFYLLKLEDRVR